MQTPPFWYRNPHSAPSWQEILLLPFSWLYGLGRIAHVFFTKRQKARIPVICVGNLNSGGSGKTPAAIALMKLIKTHDLARKPAFLLRGYGGNLVGPTIVYPKIHRPRHVGEEALILVRHGQTYIARDRLGGAQFAHHEGADMLIMDDGLQNRSLKADLNIVVINGAMGFGNRHMIPAGPLREPLYSGMERADAFIIIGDDLHEVKAMLPDHLPCFDAAIHTDKADLPDSKKRYLAFAGIGYPQKFFDYLRDDLGLDIVQTEAFEDHYAYRASDVKALQKRAAEAELTLITTEKDMQHILRLNMPSASKITVVPITLGFKEEKSLVSFLTEKLHKLSS